MKRLLFMMIAAAMVFAGCEKNDDNNDLPPDGPGSITLTVEIDYYNYDDYEIAFPATAQQLVIDWGDGSAAETYTDITAQSDGYNNFIPNITHTYPGIGTYTVQIKEEGLTLFDCYFFSSMTSLNVSGCAALQKLNCVYSSLTSLNINGCPALQRLDCFNTSLTSLNISGCPALQTLTCGDYLTSLDVSKCPALKELDCGNNQLTSLDVSKCPALEVLYCGHNQLTSLDVSKCTAIKKLVCGGSQLTSLNVSGCTALEILRCYPNQLTSLDVSKCPVLQELRCNGNQLTSLNVSGCTALNSLDCGENQLSAEALNTVLTALPNRTATDHALIYISGNPGAETCTRAIAENKGWEVH
jgi:hypothetical protein